MHYVKHFDILGVETAQIPCIELHGVPNAATEGAVGLLGVDVDSEGKEVYVCTAVNGAVYTWKSVKDGKDGVSIISTYVGLNGELLISLSNGETLNAGVVKGEKGEKGEDGTGVNIKSSSSLCTLIGDAYIDANGNIQILTSLSPKTFTNGGQVRGPKGDTGNGISSIRKTGTSGLVDTYTITYTNGATSTFTVTNGKEGKQGNDYVLTNADKQEIADIAAAKVPQGPQGDPGNDYVLTDADKREIADIVAAQMPTSGLPTVSMVDNGKMLQVVNGVWEVVDILYTGDVDILE